MIIPEVDLRTVAWGTGTGRSLLDRCVFNVASLLRDELLMKKEGKKRTKHVYKNGLF